MANTLFDVFLIIMLVFLGCCALLSVACMAFLFYMEWVEFKRDQNFYKEVERLLHD